MDWLFKTNRASLGFQRISPILALSACAVFAAWRSGIVGAPTGGRDRANNGSPQLVAVQPLPENDGQSCELVSAAARSSLTASFGQQGFRSALETSADARTPTMDVTRPPRRIIHDPNPAFSSIAVEPESNMLVVTDENLFQVLEYDRRESTPPTARMSEPKRIIGGTLTKAEMMCGVYIDPKTLDTYVLNNDTQNYVAIFSKESRGNVAPTRYLIPVGGHTFGISMDEGRQEMFLTIQAANSVVVYRKGASGKEKPLRQIVGNDTGLEDPHGIAVDTKRDLLYVSNHGSVAYRDDGKGGGNFDVREGASDEEGEGGRRFIRGSGKFDPPSITVYRHDAQGNAKPIRTIEGTKTHLNWPAQMALDEEKGEIYVANDMDHSVLVFGVEDEGNVPPRRALRGPKTGIRNPTGIALDLKNREVWVSNMGNHSAVMFPMTAEGDVSPARTIRGGPSNELSLMIGNPGGVGYDTKREEILVPN